MFIAPAFGIKRTFVLESSSQRVFLRRAERALRNQDFRLDPHTPWSFWHSRASAVANHSSWAVNATGANSFALPSVARKSVERA